MNTTLLAVLATLVIGAALITALGVCSSAARTPTSTGTMNLALITAGLTALISPDADDGYGQDEPPLEPLRNDSLAIKKKGSCTD